MRRDATRQDLNPVNSQNLNSRFLGLSPLEHIQSIQRLEGFDFKGELENFSKVSNASKPLLMSKLGRHHPTNS
jgi:hypothetical protein